MTYTTEQLLSISRADLLRVAASLGIRVTGRASAMLIDDILRRQAEILSREIRPDSVRISMLEDGLARLERANIEQGAMVAEMYTALEQLSTEHGVRLHSALKTLALKFKTRMRLAATAERK